MKTIEKTIDTLPYRSKVFEEYFNDLCLSFIDIETEGLNPSYCRVILGGLLSLHDEGSLMTQYFAESKGDEKELLQSYGKAIEKSDVIITYNGERFDLPFLKHRFSKHNLDVDLEAIQSFDLYRILHKYSLLRQVLPNLKQKSVESFLDLSSLRKDEISGAESVELYKHYLRTGSMASEAKILLHNQDDLVLLSRIIKVLDKLDLHKILFHEGFTVSCGAKKILVKDIVLAKKKLEVTALSRGIPLDYYSFETAFQATHRAKSRMLTIDIPFETKYDADYIDLESFPFDFTNLTKYPAYESGYLVLRSEDTINFAEINKILKTIFSELLRTHMV